MLMSEEKLVSSSTVEVLMGLPVGEALKESKKAECSAYADIFLERARATQAGGDEEVARA